MRIKDVILEADPKELGSMNPQMRDVLSKVHADDEAEAKAKSDAEAKAKADAEKAASMYALKHPEEVEDYIQKLKNHDWYYNYSDDGREYRKGRNEAEEIARLRKKLDPTGKIYDKYKPKSNEGLGETASPGATSAGNIASVEAPHLSPGKARGKTSYTGKPNGPSGTKAPPQPKVKQPKKKDGTAVNALDMDTSIFGSGAVKR